MGFHQENNQAISNFDYFSMFLVQIIVCYLNYRSRIMLSHGPMPPLNTSLILIITFILVICVFDGFTSEIQRSSRYNAATKGYSY